MVEFKLVLSDPKTGKSYQKEAKDDAAKLFIGKKIGDKIKGEVIDLTGYEFEIKGGSDASGFPMRWDVDGTGRKKITSVKSVGISNKKKLPNKNKKGQRKILGLRRKKAVAGNTIHEKTAQINLKIITQGKTPLDKPAEPEAPADKPAEKAK
ncbi:30S ribosomal protein S6e [Candidatus Woesearchaeota archaeon]|jgi:small subunit ribosomal protein S6e|nr:30S ribosomal protein S6e [Candidatus Woesearchaeota archaeon]MBT6519289.1 30S ribosomal protein S6e [Candidatus Woesearchaeota archaeon]MBT7367015.1 30S ribosomal protein S6e [Candidatus Woesearchaeota archaeon]